MATKQSNTPRGIRTYTGDVNEHNREHGLGFFKLADGTHGAGEFDDGHLVGISVVHRSSGETYAIDRKGNDKDGNGIYVWPAKNSYDEETWYIGEFKETKPDGFAMFKTSIGYTWIGEVNRQWMPIEDKGFWVDRYDNPVEMPIWIGSKEKFEGFGTLIARNGICYQGDWVNGQRHGWGIFTKPDGYRYEGGFKHNKKHGKGTFFKAKHNNVFEGEFANNLPNGYGIRYNPEGPGGPVIHRGTFKNGLYHGKGELRFSNCTSFFGTWCEGKLTEEDKVRYEKQTGAIYAE